MKKIYIHTHEDPSETFTNDDWVKWFKDTRGEDVDIIGYDDIMYKSKLDDKYVDQILQNAELADEIYLIIGLGLDMINMLRCTVCNILKRIAHIKGKTIDVLPTMRVRSGYGEVLFIDD